MHIDDQMLFELQHSRLSERMHMSLPFVRLSRHYVRGAQVLGTVLFVVSFLLPAVLAKDEGGWGPHGPYSGLRCALFSPMVVVASLAAFANPLTGNDSYLNRLCMLLFCSSALINPLVIGYSISRRRFRRMIAITILVCVVSSWIGAILSGTGLLIGYYVWVIGALLILAPELPEELRYAEADQDIV
jgi:hypothetical protein